MKTNAILSALLYKFAESLIVKGLGFLIGIVLARLLSPEDFGQIALIMVFINLCHTFVHSGLNTALIQNKKADHKDYSTVFYISLSIAVLSVMLLWLTAPLIGDYYQNEAIVLPLRIYSFSLPFYACTSVQQAKIQRELKFRQNMICGLIAAILSGTLGITAAWLGWGIWALILYYFSSTLITCVLLFFVVSWSPRMEFSPARAKELFSYGWKMLISGILCSLYHDIRTLAVGKLFSSAELGYYNRGEQISQIIAQTMEAAISSVMFPVLSQRQEQEDVFRRTLRSMLMLSTSLTFPVMLGLALIADPLIRLLLTEKWISCVPILSLLCFSHASFPFTTYGLVAIKAKGYSGLYMHLEIIRRIMMLGILMGSLICFRSIEAVAWGAVLSSWLDAAIVVAAAAKQFRYKFPDQFGELWKPLLASCIMGIAVWRTGLFVKGITQSLLLLLTAQISAGIVIYTVIMFLLNRSLFHRIRNHRK